MIPRHGHRIVAAALQLPTGEIVVGVRHYDEFMQMMLERIYGNTRPIGLQRPVEGFVDNMFHFVNRREAMEIARAANQVLSKSTNDHLYSEDVW